MWHQFAADLVLLLHFAFVAFVALGGLLVLRWPKVAFVHLPSVVWGALLMLNGWICPLTPLENRLRLAGGGQGYQGGFIEQYIWPLVYPPGLTRDAQRILAALVLLMSVGLYGFLLWRRWRRRGGKDEGATLL